MFLTYIYIYIYIHTCIICQCFTPPNSLFVYGQGLGRCFFRSGGLCLVTACPSRTLPNASDAHRSQCFSLVFFLPQNDTANKNKDPRFDPSSLDCVRHSEGWGLPSLALANRRICAQLALKCPEDGEVLGKNHQLIQRQILLTRLAVQISLSHPALDSSHCQTAWYPLLPTGALLATCFGEGFPFELTNKKRVPFFPMATGHYPK